jgi:hypothetical protein
LPRHCCCHWLIAFIITECQRKRNGKKPLHFDNFTVLLLAFFQLNFYFCGERMICDISAHRLIFAPPPPPLPPPPDCVYYNRAARQKEWWDAITIWQFYSSFSPLFQLICNFGSKHVICDISAHRLIFALSLLPPDCVYYNRVVMQKE